MAILINSIPKSGTYMMGLLLSTLGFTDNGIHLRDNVRWDWNDAANLLEIKKDPNKYATKSIVSDNIKYLMSGFTYGHLSFSEENRLIIEGIPDLIHLFCVRDLRDCLVSNEKFTANRLAINGDDRYYESLRKTPREAFLDGFQKTGRAFIERAQRQAEWVEHKSVFVVRFEEIMGDAGRESQLRFFKTLCDRIGVDKFNEAQESFRSRIRGKETRTLSGERTVWRDYWGTKTEDLFRDCGGHHLNQFLGYEKGSV